MVSLNEILISKEERVKTQRSLLCEYKKPLICFTMNIAGPVKNSPLIERTFGIGTECILSKIPPEKILKKIGDDADIIIIDFHCETTSEKLAYGNYFDGKVTAVVGTHTLQFSLTL